MKHNLVNFTRGSQLLGHFGFMFAAGLEGPLIVTLLVVLGLVYWDVSSALDDYCGCMPMPLAMPSWSSIRTSL